MSQCGGQLRETGEGTIKTNTHHTPRVHSDDTNEFVCGTVRRFFKSLSTRGVLGLMRNGVVCFMIDMSNGYDIADQSIPCNGWCALIRLSRDMLAPRFYFLRCSTAGLVTNCYPI